MNRAVPSRDSRNLDRPDFEGLLRRFDPDSKRSDEKYEHLRQRLIKFFEWNNCWSDAEDLADVTMDIVARKPGDFVIENVPAFTRRVASRVLMKFKKRSAQVVSLADLPEVQGSDQDRDVERNKVEDIDHEKAL